MIHKIVKKFLPLDPATIDWKYKGVYINRKVYRDLMGCWEVLDSKPTGRKAPAVCVDAHNLQAFMKVVYEYELTLRKMTEEELEFLRQEAILCN